MNTRSRNENCPVHVDASTASGRITKTTAATTWMVFVFLKSLYFSAITFATLGYGDVQPIGTVTRGIAAFESLAGSVLLALLVFVLTARIR